MIDHRALTAQIDHMRRQHFVFDSVPLSTLLAWHGEQMAIQRELDEVRRSSHTALVQLQVENDALRTKVVSLNAEITALRAYGDKDRTAMADEFLGRVRWTSTEPAPAVEQGHAS